MASNTQKKVVLVGQFCVGKTALVIRYSKNKFDELSPYQPTIGAAFVSKQVSVGGKGVTLGIWDTAGSERFEAMNRLYYRGGKAAIVCYDISDSSSFIKAKTYVNDIRANNPQCMLYVCGNKSDLIDSGERLREVSFDEAVSYGEGVNAKMVIETSSKTGQNVAELFTRIAEDLLERPSDNLERQTSKFQIDDSVQNQRKDYCRSC